MERKRIVLALEDGTVFTGSNFGASGEKDGEIIFNTGMTGYQEILSDPSYKGQIVTMTYPLIGNYGIANNDNESLKLYLTGFVVRERSKVTSNWRAENELDDFLKRNNVIGIEGIDTRALTKHIRLAGAMRAVISTEDMDGKSLSEKAKKSPGLIGRDLVKEVTCKKRYVWNEEFPPSPRLPTSLKLRGTSRGAGKSSRVSSFAKASHFAQASGDKSEGRQKFKVVVIDCGVKFNILRELANLGCKVIVVPANTKSKDILALYPDGLLVSNGPGDPAGVKYVAQTVRELIGKLPIFGICLGHQMLGLAFGGETYKLKFGHHGCNHPVKDLRTGKILITVQNHGFCVRMKKNKNRYYLAGNKDVEITHINLNDMTAEGLRHRELPISAVQFHPEAAPGPHDAKYLFTEFIEMMNPAPSNRVLDPAGRIVPPPHPRSKLRGFLRRGGIKR